MRPDTQGSTGSPSTDWCSQSGADNFTLTVAHPQQVNLQNVLALNQQTAVSVFSSAEFQGVHLWAVDSNNAQALAAGGGFQGPSSPRFMA
jgi:hypothetical protein